MNSDGKLFFPVISLSNTKNLKIASENFKNIQKISSNQWFLPEDLTNNQNILEPLKEEGYINYCQKFGKLICWTDIYLAF